MEKYSKWFAIGIAFQLTWLYGFLVGSAYDWLAVLRMAAIAATLGALVWVALWVHYVLENYTITRREKRR